MFTLPPVSFTMLLALTLAPAGLCAPAAAHQHPRLLCARLRPALTAPRMAWQAASEQEEEETLITSKSEIFSEMSTEERTAFFQQLDDECVAAGVSQSSRFRGLLEAMGEEGASQWRVLSTGQIVESAKHFPGLTAMPAWDPQDFDDDDQPFPWLGQLQAHVPAIAAELRAVCDAELPAGYDLGLENRRAMERLSGLTETERSIYSPGFDDHPTNGYCHTVLMTNDEPQPVARPAPDPHPHPHHRTHTRTRTRTRTLTLTHAHSHAHQVAALFPCTMAALDACSVPLGVRLVAFGKQLPHTALHWHGGMVSSQWSHTPGAVRGVGARLRPPRDAPGDSGRPVPPAGRGQAAGRPATASGGRGGSRRLPKPLVRLVFGHPGTATGATSC